MWEVAEHVDDPHRRLELASSVVALRGAGRVAPNVAAVALVHLAEGTSSVLLLSSIAEGIGVSAGRARTPAGLVAAA
ncbi:MAG: hypothetical protein ACRDY3_06250 [Acidimicrobiales bacterium]